MPDAIEKGMIDRTKKYIDEGWQDIHGRQMPPVAYHRDTPITSPGPNPYEERFHSELAFISFILGMFGLLLPLFSVLAIVFGIAGLMQINREHMQGKWMAILGIILGFAGIIIIIAVITFSIQFLETYLMRFGGIETLVGNLGR